MLINSYRFKKGVIPFPEDIYAHFDASLGVLQTDDATPAEDGDQTGQWNDQSGNGRNAQLGVWGASSNVVYRTSGSFPYLDPNNRRPLSMGISGFPPNISFFIVADKLSSPTFTYIGTDSSGNSAGGCDDGGTNSPHGGSLFQLGISSYRVNGSSAPSNSSGALFAAIPSGIHLFAATNLNFSSRGAFRLFEDPFTPYHSGIFYEVLIYDSVLSESEVGEVENFILSKYSIS